MSAMYLIPCEGLRPAERHGAPSDDERGQPLDVPHQGKERRAPQAQHPPRPEDGLSDRAARIVRARDQDHPGGFMPVRLLVNIGQA